MRRSIVTKVVFIVFVLCAVLIPWPSDAQQKPITLKVAHGWPVGHKSSLVFDQWARDLEKRTNGKVKVTIYPGGVLMPIPQCYDAVIKGIADVSAALPAVTPGRFPLLEAFDLPIVLSRSAASSAVGTKMANAFYAKFKPKEMEDTKILFLNAITPIFLFTKTKPVTELEDLKGLKIRSSGTTARFIKLLGGIPVSLPITESYDALSRGIVDGIITVYEAMEGFSLIDHINYATENYNTSFVSLIIIFMNKDKWNSLPKDIQITIDQMSEEYAERFAKESWDYLGKTGKELLIKKGGRIIALSQEEDARWAERVKPLTDEYVKNMKAKELPGEEAIKFIQDYLKPYNQ